MPPRANLVGVAAVGALGVMAIGLMAAPAMGVSSTQPFVAAAIFIGMMSVAITTMGSGHPFPRLGAANLVTMVRAMFVALLASLALAPWLEVPAMVAWVVVGVTAAMAALDGVDGWLARRSGMASPFGARFDMETDALHILVLSVLVWQFGKAGPWVLGCGLMRYAFVAAGWRLSWLGRPLRSTFRGKAVAIAQLAGLGLALAPIVMPPPSAIVAGVTLAALAWSFALDVRHLWLHRPR